MDKDMYVETPTSVYDLRSYAYIPVSSDIQWRTDPRLCKLFFKFTPKDTSDQVMSPPARPSCDTFFLTPCIRSFRKSSLSSVLHLLVESC